MIITNAVPLGRRFGGAHPGTILAVRKGLADSADWWPLESGVSIFSAGKPEL
jgi:hypothetical protein